MPRPELPDVQRLFDAHATPLCRMLQMLTGSRFVAETTAAEVFRAFPDEWAAREVSSMTPEQLLYRVAVVRVRRLTQRTEGPTGDRAGERLLRCISALPSDEREVLVLYDGDRARAPADIATILGLTEDDVLQRLQRAQARLRASWKGGET